MSQHWYDADGILQPNGVGWPSATTILAVRANPGLQAWRDVLGAEEADRQRDLKADLGSMIHEACEFYIKEDIASVHDEEELPFLTGFLNWLEDFKPTDLKPEVFVYSDTYGYAGTADLICTIDDELWLVDFKTAKNVTQEKLAGYALQLAAYQQAWFEMTGKQPKRAVLQLTDQTQKGYRWHPEDKYPHLFRPKDFKTFLAHKTIFDHFQATVSEPAFVAMWAFQ